MRRALVTGGTYDDTAPIAVFVKNVAETNSHLFDEIVVYHNGIKIKDQKIIQKYFKTRFVEYRYNLDNRNDEIISYFTNMVFCKYECFTLLDEFDEVVWSDYDVVIKGKLDNFCNVKGTMINVLECNDKLKTMFYKNITCPEIKKYDLEVEGVGTPLFALSNKLKKHREIYKWCYEKTELWSEDLYLPEQCIFSLAVQQFEIELERFSFTQYACYPSKAKGDELIIHSAGQPKFWNGIDDSDWNRRYAEWLKEGGSPYREWGKVLKRKYLFLKTRLLGIRGKEHE